MFLTQINPPAAKQVRTQNEIWKLLHEADIDADTGERISVNKAMMQTTVWACVRIVSESIAQLPIQIQERSAVRWMDVIDHDALALLANPNGWQTQHELIAHLVVWMELKGNSFAFKRTGRTGGPQSLIPLRADQVEVKQDKDWAITYVYDGNTYTPAEMLHLRNFGTENYIGLSTITNATNAIGLAMAMEKHGASLFKHGASVGLTIQAPGDLGEEVYQRLEKRLTPIFHQ